MPLVEYDVSSDEDHTSLDTKNDSNSTGLFDLHNIAVNSEPLEKPLVLPLTCCICQSPKKYKCPECERLSCSVACVKEHKSLFGCTGSSLKKHIAFVSKDSFNEKNFRRDIHFIEQLNRNLSNTFTQNKKERQLNHNEQARTKQGLSVKGD